MPDRYVASRLDLVILDEAAAALKKAETEAAAHARTSVAMQGPLRIRRRYRSEDVELLKKVLLVVATDDASPGPDIDHSP